MSIKITNEAPVGLKAGMKRSYQWVTQDTLDTIGVFLAKEWRTLLYTMCFLHSIVQERRKFGPVGWSIPYEFNQGDLSASVQFLQNHMAEMESKKTKEVTWSTVRYMVAQIQYGGRITDDWDRHLMDTYAKRFLRSEIFEDKFQFYTGYIIPCKDKSGANVDIASFRTAVEDIPMTDNPEVFGLHPNADLTVRLQQFGAMILTILETQPKTSGSSGGMSREESVNKSAEEFLSTMPANFDKEDVKDKIKSKMGGFTPLNIFLRQEVDRLQNVISLVRTTLRDIQLAIAGTIALNDLLIASINSLYDALVPANWLKVSWQAPTLGLWFNGLIHRTQELNAWVQHGRPKAFWLTGFFNPQGFLTSMQQEVARKHQGWALDDVTIYTEVQKMEKDECKDAPPDGVYIWGLFLEGCAWSKKENKLVDAAPKQLFHPLPILWVTAVLNKSSPDAYECPCYRNKKRTDLNYIFTVKIRTEHSPSYWTLRGVALLCSKD
jgi:dynein heavy chain